MNKLNKDDLILIAIQLDLPDLLNFCKTSTKVDEKVCKNKYFWMRKLKEDYPNSEIVENYELTYKLNYLKKKFDYKGTISQLYDLKQLALI